jgi:RNA polymerase sigma factor (sigma-70 family)
MRTALTLTRDLYVAQDLVQETLARMFENWDRVENNVIDTPAAYAQVVLVRTFVSQRRRRSFWERPTDSLANEVAGRSEDTALRLVLADALASLRPRDRAVLVLRFICDRSVDEVAVDLQMTSVNVRAVTKRGLARLRAALGVEALADLAVGS